VLERGRTLAGVVLHESYRLTRLIGEGGMGAVYEAVHVRLAKKRFAVKMLLPSVLEVPDVFTRFRREAEIATELGHPHIVDVFDFNTTPEGHPYMVMEFLEGEDLGKRLFRRGRLPAAEVTEVLAQAGSALQAAHDHGIVHRDMKPDNIFLVGPEDGPIRVKVLDFGISKIKHGSASMATRENAIIGTPSFMSPEQAEGSVRDIDHTTDIFALGAIAYHALSGELPFAAPTLPGVLYKVCHHDPTPLSQVVAVPPAVDGVLARALAKRKVDRYPRADLFVEELAGALAVRGSGEEPRSRLATARTLTEPTGPHLPLTALPANAYPPTLTPVPCETPPDQLPTVTPVPILASPARTTLGAANGEVGSLPQASRRPGRVLAIAGGAVLVLAAAAVAVVATRGPAADSPRVSTSRPPGDSAAASRSTAADAGLALSSGARDVGLAAKTAPDAGRVRRTRAIADEPGPVVRTIPLPPRADARPPPESRDRPPPAAAAPKRPAQRESPAPKEPPAPPAPKAARKPLVDDL
jgi:serine/threonine-protein kinase